MSFRDFVNRHQIMNYIQFFDQNSWIHSYCSRIIKIDLLWFIKLNGKVEITRKCKLVGNSLPICTESSEDISLLVGGVNIA